ALHLVQMESLEAHCVLPLGATQMDAVVLDVFDVLRPGVDQRDIFASPCEMPANVPAHGACSHKDNPLTHDAPPLCARSPAAQALCCAKLCGGIVARPPA